MSDQASLFGFEPQPAKSKSPAKARERPPYTLFFAVIPDDGTACAIVEIGKSLAAEKGLQGNPLEAHRLHVSLHAVAGGEAIPADIIEAARRVGDSISAASFDVRFDCAMTYAASGAFVLVPDPMSDGIRQLHTALGIAMANEGFMVQRSFTPHMTILYGRNAAGKYPITPFEWKAKEFALICSHNGKHLHEYLARWSLRA